MNDNMSPADLAAVVGNNHYGCNNGFGFGDGSWIWLILILALFGGWGNGNGFGNYGGAFNNEYAWLSNGQKEIMQNTTNGFDTLQLANHLTGIDSGIQGISTQLCNGFANTNQTINSGFAGAEIAANSRQMANMQQDFNAQISTLNGFNNLNNALQNCCCENRLGIANLNSTILSENCADRAALADGLKDVLINQTANTQRILDQMCNDKIDAKNEKIADLERQLQMADLKASQIEQTAALKLGQVQANNDLYSLLNSCPIPSTPVYGRTPIFNPSSCGCGNTFGSTIA